MPSQQVIRKRLILVSGQFYLGLMTKVISVTNLNIGQERKNVKEKEQKNIYVVTNKLYFVWRFFFQTFILAFNNKFDFVIISL